MVKTADKRRDTLDELPEPVVADVMTTDVVTATIDMKLLDVVNLLLKKGVSNVPVVEHLDKGMKLVGIITERDCLDYLTNEVFYGDPNISVGSSMKNVPVCVSPDTDVFTVSSIFLQQGFRHLPVVDNSYLLGVVSRRDILQGLKQYHLKTQRIQAAERKRPDLLKILMNRRLIIK